MRTWLLLLYVCTGARFVYGVLKLQILHTNDMHARFLEVDESTVACNTALSQANKCYGGFTRIRQAAIDATESAKKLSIPSILLNAGDTFQGTPYYSAYKWEIAAPLTDAIQFDAMVRNSTIQDSYTKRQ